MSQADALKTYREKRDFSRTPEPAGEARPAGEKPIFVVQKHAASTLHYDFRLEVAGVLKSWAVPKGPSPNPKDKRLAVPTEDHPMEYADFEGNIPQGEYGGGTVIVWDMGTYRNLARDDDRPVPMEEALERGRVSVWLEGHKLRGGYALIRTGKGEDARWLLIKMDDDEADPGRDLVRDRPESVLSGRTVEEVAAQAEDESEPE
ncbi:MAG: DNA ligase [Anaerolineae bacterium]|nr:DNA ligase [Anaerolineae bacterium]